LDSRQERYKLVAGVVRWLCMGHRRATSFIVKLGGEERRPTRRKGRFRIIPDSGVIHKREMFIGRSRGSWGRLTDTLYNGRERGAKDKKSEVG